MNINDKNMIKLYLIYLYISGEIQQRGVVLPFAPVVYKSLLSRLRADGITAREVVKPLN